MKSCEASLDFFQKTVLDEMQSIVSQTDYASLSAAAELICNAKAAGNRLHISGIGKPGHIAGYIASLMSSTGTPAYFLHGTEAVHGSCGQLVPGDVVIFISNSGQTEEMKSTILAIKNNGCKVIGVTDGRESWLAKQSDVTLYAGVSAEGGPLNRAPRASILAETYVLQALSVLLQADAEVSPRQYVSWHPGGALGFLLKNEK